MKKIREKIKVNFDALEDALKHGRHLDKDSIIEMLALIQACSKYWSVLDDEHRDFLNAARFAVEDEVPWE